MTPTIEEVKKVAWNLRKSLPFGAPRDEVTLTDQQLQAFAQHYKEEDRKELHQILFDGYAVFKELDAKASARTSAENVSDVLDAVVRIIRNNTGE